MSILLVASWLVTVAPQATAPLEVVPQAAPACDLTDPYITRDGRVAITRCTSQLVLWDLRAGRRIRTIDLLAPSGAGITCRVSPDESKAVCASDKAHLGIYDLHTGARLVAGNAETLAGGVSFTPDGSHIVSGAHVLDAKTLQPARGLAEMFYSSANAITSDGRWVVSLLTSGDGDLDVLVHDIATGQRQSRAYLKERAPGLYREGICTLDAEHVVITTGSWVRIHEVPSLAVVETIPWLGHGPVGCSRDGRYLSFTEWTEHNHTVIWDVGAKRPLFYVPGRQGNGSSAAFAADNRFVFVTGADELPGRQFFGFGEIFSLAEVVR